MRYMTLRWGLVLAGIGIWLALTGWQEVLDDIEAGELPEQPTTYSRFMDGYRAGRIRGLADARDMAEDHAQHLAGED